MHLEAIFDLALVHGHIFLIGALIPLAVTWLLMLALLMGALPFLPSAWGAALYGPGAIAAVLLMIYKG